MEDRSTPEPRRLREVLRSRLVRSSVPEGRHSVWYYFGGLTLFLFGVMLVTGLLLAVYYEPSAAPATTSDGSPLVAARITAPTIWHDREYAVGEIVPVPWDAERGAPVMPGALKGKAEPLIDPATKRPILPSAAWVSVEHTVMRQVEFGALIRSTHSYAANLLMAAIFIHMFSAFLMKAYRRPRATLWVSGVVLLTLMLGFGFTGYLLPWNRLAYFATRVGVSYPDQSIPWLGPVLAEMVRGGEDVGRATLTRIFAAHAVALPLATLILVGLHLLLVQFHGLAVPARSSGSRGRGVSSALGGGSLALLAGYPILTGEFDPVSPYVILPLTILPVVTAHLLSGAVYGTGSRTERGESVTAIPFYANYIYRDFLCWLLALGIILTLAIVAPWSVSGDAGIPVDLTKPLPVPKGIHPEWYFMAAYQLLRVAPGAVALAVMALGGAVWLAAPWLDRRTSRGERSPAFTALGIAVLAGLTGLMVWGYGVLDR